MIRGKIIFQEQLKKINKSLRKSARKRTDSIERTVSRPVEPTDSASHLSVEPLGGIR